MRRSSPVLGSASDTKVELPEAFSWQQAPAFCASGPEDHRAGRRAGDHPHHLQAPHHDAGGHGGRCSDLPSESGKRNGHSQADEDTSPAKGKKKDPVPAKLGHKFWKRPQG